MKFNIRGDKIKITPAINDYIIDKIGKLDKYLAEPSEITANVLVKVRGIDQIVEVTIYFKKVILRAEEQHEDLYAAIDLVSEKLERQIRKYKTRINKRKQHDFDRDFIVDTLDESDKENISKIVKRKTLEIKPMSDEEAILQMDLLDHDFFLYNSAINNNVCVIYKRKDGNYGVITIN